ncbi:MAG: GNAT family N-acetyltransferase [Campylobacterota bacterium]
MSQVIKYNNSEVLNGWISNHNWQELESYLKTIPQSKFRSLEFMVRGLLEIYKYRNLVASLDNLKKACELSPSETRFLNTYSELLLKAKKNDEALHIAIQSTSLEPDNPMSALSLMHAALANRKYDIAYSAVKKANENLTEKFTDLKEQTQFMQIKLSPFWWSSPSGKKVSLKRINPQHREFLLHIRKNKQFQRHYNILKSDSQETLDRDISNANKPPLDFNKIEWVIEKNNVPIGVAGLVNIDMYNSRAEMQIGIPEEISSTDGLEASLLVLEFAFCEIKLDKLVSYVYSSNQKSQKNTLHVGFHQEGFLHSHIYDKTTDTKLDVYMNGYLRENFFKNKQLMKIAKRVLGRQLV